MTRPNLWRWLWRVLVEWAAILLCFGAVALWPHVAVVFAAVLVIGTRQHALAILGHDGGHRLASRNRWLNDALTTLLCLGPLSIGLVGYRRFHFAHHRATNSDADPELLHKRLVGQWEAPLRPWRLARQVALDLIGFGLLHMAIAVYLMRPRAISDFLTVIGWAASLIVLGWFVPWAPALWIWCMLTSFWAAFRLRIWTEHVGANNTHRLSRPPLWARLIFLPHGTWCHWAHHAHPGIPCWALPEWYGVNPAKDMTLAELVGRLRKERP